MERSHGPFSPRRLPAAFLLYHDCLFGRLGRCKSIQIAFFVFLALLSVRRAGSGPISWSRSMVPKGQRVWICVY